MSQFSTTIFAAAFTCKNTPFVFPATPGLTPRPMLLRTVMLEPAVSSAWIRSPGPFKCELTIRTGSLVAFFTAGMSGFVLRQFPLYVPPFAIVIGDPYVTCFVVVWLLDAWVIYVSAVATALTN